MKRILSLLVALFVGLTAVSAFAEEVPLFRFAPYQGGAMGMQFIDVTVDPDADIMSLWPTQDVYNVVLEKLTWDDYANAEVIFQADVLSSNQVINLKAYLTDVMPAFRVTCEDLNGQTARWYLADSGEDGSLLLLPAADVEQEWASIFDQLSGVEFTYSSGAGAWGVFLKIEDGKFTGEYHDSEMGEAAEAYPSGTEYGCLFHGELAYAGQIDEYAYALKLVSLENDEGQLPELIADGVRYVTTAPAGLEHTETLTLYVPGCPIEALPEGLLPWLHLSEEAEALGTLQTYALYSAADESGFIGEPAI